MQFRRPADEGAAPLARGLGWFSLALGAAQVLVPSRVERLVGVQSTPDVRATMTGIGLQELALGAGILRSRTPAGWLWARVAGDAMHLAILGTAATSRDSRRSHTTAAMAAVAGVAALDVVAAVRAGAGAGGAVHTRTVTTVNRPVDEVYDFWANLENLPRFMSHLRAVERHGGNRSHWVATGPGRSTIEWDAELVEQVPHQRLVWRSLPGADVDNHGSVQFAPAPGDRGTEVTVDLHHVVPGGRLGRAVARLFGEHPEQQASDDLRRFKQVMEAGEVVRSSGTPEGSLADRQWHQEPAVPAR